MPTALRVLIVEDNSDDAEVMVLHLVAAGFAPEWRRVETEAEYVAALATPLDLILADWQLPNFSGLRALSLMTAHGLDIPFVIVSGVVGEDMAIEALRQGAADYVLKDRPARLGLAVQRALADRRLRQENAQVQRAVRASEEWHRAVFNGVQDAILVESMDGQILAVNDQACTMYGYTRAEFLTKRVADLVLGTQPFLIDGMAAAPEIVQETIDVRADGRPFPAEISGRREILDGKEVLLVIVRDITARRRAEEQLRLQSGALAATANTIMITDREGTIQWVNPAFCRLTGYNAPEAYGQNPRILKSGLQSEEFYRELWTTILGGKTWHGDFANRRKDGSIFYEEATITPLCDTAGQITHFVAVKQDITARKQHERELAAIAVQREALREQIAAQAQQMQQIMDAAPQGMLLLDANGVVLLANPVAVQDPAILAQTDEPWRGLGDHPVAEVLALAAQASWHELHVQARTFYVMVRPLLSQAHAGTDKTPPESYVVVINDVSQAIERQRYEQAQERLATVGQMAAGIAHDFNNILGTIAVYAEILCEAAGLSDRQRSQVVTIRAQVDRAAKLIRQILDFSRRAPVQHAPLDLLPLTKELVRLLERTLPENMVIQVTYDRTEYIIDADPTQMQQVLMNLAVNARDAMPGGGRLTLTFTTLEVSPAAPPLPDLAPGQWLRLDLQDTGTGIAPEHVAHIFEPFFTTKEPGKGTGLGLAQVYGIVKQSHGAITVKTQPGDGTTFAIYLPLISTPLAEQTVAQRKPPPRGQGQTVLLVEDNLALQEATADLLAMLDYHVLCAANGHEALAVLAVHAQRVDLVLSDLIMPGMGGLQLRTQLAAQYPQLNVILMSGYASDVDAPADSPHRVGDWLPKPFSIDALATKIADVISRQ